jgi:tetratricopeptide (TPR) repeat protein
LDDKGTQQQIRRLEQHLADKPDSERFAELAEAYVAEARWEDAARVCETGLGYHPEQPAGHLVYAKALVGQRLLEDGIRSFERACSLRARDVGIRADIGLFLLDRGHVQESIPYLQSSIRIDPSDPRVLHLKERIEEQLGEEFERIETGRWQREDVFAESEAEPDWNSDEDEFSQPTARVDHPLSGAGDTQAAAAGDLNEDDDDEPPTVYDVNPLARQAAGEPDPGDQDRQQQQTLYDEQAGLRAEVAHAVDGLADPGAANRAALEDEELAQPNRNEPPTMFEPQQQAPDPWDVASGVGPMPKAEPPTLFEEASPAGPSAASGDSTRVSDSRPRGPMFPDPLPQAAPTTAISYWKVFLVVVPFLLAAVAGGLYFGFQHLRNEKVNGLLEQSLGSISQDTFAGYSDARLTLQKLLELEEDHARGRSLLALVSARLHAEYGPNLALHEEARKRIGEVPVDEDTQVDLLWARFQASQDSDDAQLAKDLAAAQHKTPKEPRLMALAGEMAIRSGDQKSANQWLVASLAEDPSNPRTLAALAGLEAAAGERGQASERLLKALAANSAHVQSLLLLARLRIDQQTDLDRAAEDMERLLKLPQVTNARRSSAHLLSAELAFLRGDRSRALAGVQAASDLMSDDAEVQQSLARLCLQFYELDEAAARARRVLELRPDDIQTQLFLIGCDLPRGKSKQALAALEGLLGKRVPAGPFFLLRGQALFDQGRYAAALADLGNIPQEAPERATAQALEVMAYLEMGDKERARREVNDLLAKHPKLALAHVAMGLYRSTTRMRRTAETSFQSAIQIDPRVYQAHVELARMAFRAKQFDKAEKSLADALYANPYDVQAHHLLGLVKLATGDPKAALDAFARVVIEQPDSGPALVGMAEALLDLGQLDKAITAIKKARRAGAEDAHALHVQGQVYLANGRFHTAIQALTKADAEQPKDPEILADLGLAQLGVRNLSRAEKALEESLRRSRRRQRLPRAQEGLARIQVARKKFSDAARAYERAAIYAKEQARSDDEVTRLYLEAGRTMLKDTRSGDGRYSRARRLFRLAVNSAGQNAEPLYEVAATYDREEKLLSARKAYQEVLDVAPDHALTLYRLGLLEFDDGKDQRAKELLTRFLKTEPSAKLARMARKVLNKIK